MKLQNEEKLFDKNKSNQPPPFLNSDYANGLELIMGVGVVTFM